MEEKDFPALYRSANELSLNSQLQFFTALRCHLLTLVIASVLSIVSISHWSVAALQVFALLGALACSIYLFSVRPEKLWYGGRAVAESIKTITWRYVCRAEPFQGDHDVARKDFRQTLKAVIEQNKEVCRALTDHLEGTQISPVMEEMRGKELNERKATYVESRIGDQHTWYANKAKFNRRKSRYFFWALIAINILAVVCAVVRVANVEVPFWPTDVFVAAAASTLSWMQAKRFSELAASYSLTSHEIGLIKEEAKQPDTDEKFSVFVGDAENAFSREHTQWVARKDA
ncbi:DUF4231 domain-containing protein [Pseudomonas chlororaphis]|uniref:DUF4231 domain-containing protein n=1 Tax=Pseudomonas chlororaphis TaxID=587753 RepID=UPI000F576F11|nr:DUF4231 domain-containing protein [Pseudomonas chlororaphis]AZC81784.1 Integral membrane protein [Pseudomonas chlororaphis subsp. piscium]AZC88975.1 Integral membrane protein [Pseudomonas chlororaphis subsp. piscium]